MRSLWNTIRILAALLAVGFAPFITWRSFAEESFIRYWLLAGAPIITLALVALWYLTFGWGPFIRRARHFAWFAGIVAVLGLLGKLLLRYDGSTSGTSLPRYVWRWEKGASAESSELRQDETGGPPKRLAQASVPGGVDSPQFAGPNRDAIWPETTLMASFDWALERPELLWRRAIGLGWSGFAVSGRRAVTQEQRGGQELVTCYDLLTGELLWSHQEGTSYYAQNVSGKEMAGDGPRATPTIYRDHVYAHGATGLLNCLRLETGEAVWQRDVLEETGGKLLQWGQSSSPLIVPESGLVVVTGGEKSGSTLVAYEAETGAPAWKIDGRGASYSSPRLIPLHGMTQIVSVNAVDVTGHDPATGRELWAFAWPGIEPKVGQPVDVAGDRVLVTASYGAGSHLLQIERSGDLWSARSLWRSNRLKTKFSSATVRGPHAFGMDEGRLACVNLEDGSLKWKVAGDYGFAQHLQAGDRLLIQAEPGFVALAAAKADGFQELGRLEALTSMTWNPPTLAGIYLLVRNDREAVCFKLPAKKP